MKEAILQMLKSGTDFISGQDLCEYFKVSRTAVWKVINQLKEEGYEIEAVNRKGYRLVSSPDILSESEILSGLSTEVLGKKIYRYDCIGSTNDQARMLAENGAPDGSLVIAGNSGPGKGPQRPGLFCTAGQRYMDVAHFKTGNSSGGSVHDYIARGDGCSGYAGELWTFRRHQVAE